MNYYQAIIHNRLKLAVLRHVRDGGISDKEWLLGVRTTLQAETRDALLDALYAQDIEVVDTEEWLDELGYEEDVPSNNFVYRKPRDKWDFDRIIY